MAFRPILLTGFQPFGGMHRNPSETVACAMRDEFEPGHIFSTVLPVDYTAGNRLGALISEIHPAAWIGFGLSQKAKAITLERLAYNLDDTPMPDNRGNVRQGRLIEADGPAAFESTLPLADIHAALERQNIPVTYSDDPGRYICNHVFYHAAAAVQRLRMDTLVGFIHLPWPCDWEEVPAPGHSLALGTLVQAAKACVGQIDRMRK